MLLLSKMSFEECRKLEKLEKTAFLSLAERRRKLKSNLFFHSQTSFHSFSFSFFNKQLPFIITHSISSNQAKAKANQDEKRKKQRKWTSSSTIDQIENPIRLTRAWREYEQTTLPHIAIIVIWCLKLRTWNLLLLASRI